MCHFQWKISALTTLQTTQIREIHDIQALSFKALKKTLKKYQKKNLLNVFWKTLQKPLKTCPEKVFKFRRKTKSTPGKK